MTTCCLQNSISSSRFFFFFKNSGWRFFQISWRTNHWSSVDIDSLTSFCNPRNPFMVLRSGLCGGHTKPYFTLKSALGCIFGVDVLLQNTFRARLTKGKYLPAFLGIENTINTDTWLYLQRCSPKCSGNLPHASLLPADTQCTTLQPFNQKTSSTAAKHLVFWLISQAYCLMPFHDMKPSFTASHW